MLGQGEKLDWLARSWKYICIHEYLTLSIMPTGWRGSSTHICFVVAAVLFLFLGRIKGMDGWMEQVINEKKERARGMGLQNSEKEKGNTRAKGVARISQ